MNEKNIFQKLDLRIEQLVTYPGCDQKTLNTRKTMWIATFFGLVHVILHTGAFLVFAPQLLHILITYGYILLLILLLALFIVPQLKATFIRYYLFHLSILLFITFYFILKLGGIATSAGLIFACLAFVLSSIPLQNMRITFFLFSLFTVVIILSGLLVPWLTVPEEITPRLNAIVFVMNTLSMSIFIVYLTIIFFAQQTKIEKLEASKLIEMNEAKNKLFTNITHEFRTPLTIIQGMANLIRGYPDEWLEKGTQKIEVQTKNLLTLVNQMLDLAKLEAGAMHVHIFQSDIISYLKYLTDSFISLARGKNIQLNFIPESRHLMMDFDHEKIMYIVSNLITNAIKFTPNDGTVNIYAGLMPDKNEFVIKVSDNGPEIPSEHLPFLFDRFFRVEDDLIAQEVGSGLGLALVKELVKLFGGSVHVSSSKDLGNTFTVILPVTNIAPEKEIFTDNYLSPDDFVNVSKATEDRTDQSETVIPATDLPILLVVEDSQDLKLYLNALLQGHYQLDFASNGKAGLQKAFEHIPDIIVSDIMMPVMDGISMLDALKHDMRTSHIPVILLTAKADIDSRLNGLDNGADDYLAKPFNEAELLIRLRKLLELRKILHQRYASGEQPISAENHTLNLEDSFIQKIRKVMEESLDDDNFDVHQLCLTAGMSRSQLYRKFKSLTNTSVIDYFWTLRLHKAKILLQTTTMNISEVAIAVGFKNLSHFSKSFKNQFGMNPSTVRK